jgi:hypothetical protein
VSMSAKVFHIFQELVVAEHPSFGSQVVLGLALLARRCTHKLSIL